MLTPPSIVEYGLFIGTTFGSDPDDATRLAAEYKLQEATDALFVLTGLTEYPEDPQVLRIVKYAICDLARWLQAQFEESDAINSPFSGERIGSYSYQKSQMTAQARQGHETGIYWLDLALALLRALSPYGSGISVDSENVMSPCGGTFETQKWLEDHEVVFSDNYGW